MKARPSTSSALLVLLGLVALPDPARADRRGLTHTYEYMTQGEGVTELELWTTQSRPDLARDDQHFELALEVEHGITAHWDVALYHVLAEDSGDAAIPAAPLHLEEVKLESRYRLAERGERPVDLTLYGELAKHFGRSRYDLEARLIAAHDFGALTAVANLSAEVPVGHDVADPSLIAGYAAGLVYELSPRFKLGGEAYGELADGTTSAAVAPAASWSPTPDLWVAASAGLGLVHADGLAVQAVIGLHL